MRGVIFLLLLCSGGGLFAQKTIVKGRVNDAVSGESLPFVNIFFTGTSIGTTTDFDGFYSLETDEPVDSISASYIGYQEFSKKIIRGRSQTVNISITEVQTDLPEVIVKPGENPALRIIRAAQKNRYHNNYEKLSSFQYESFTKVQLAVDKLSDKDQKRRIYRDIIPLFDTVSTMTDGATKPILPVFISETISDFYFQKNPEKSKEVIKASKITGVGVEDGSVMSQLLGSTFQQYNFHVNWIRILEKDFVSPVGEAAIGFYVFTLKDSTYIEGHKCYRIECNPKRPSDLAFTGTMWITDTSFAIKRLQFFMDKRANLNFLDQFKIQQEYTETNAGAWVPSKTRVTLNLEEPSSAAPGVIAVFYVSNKDIVVNREYDSKFFDETLILQDDALDKSEAYWDEHRHEKLTEGDLRVMHMIDTLNNLPAIKSLKQWINLIVSGYKRVGPVDIGPYAFLYGYNALEGHRFRLGFRTNYRFSEKIVFRGYVAYGTFDEKFKYSGQVEWLPDKKDWTSIGLKYRNDVDQIGITDQNYDQSNLFTSIALIQSSQLNRTIETQFWMFRQYDRSWSQRITFHDKQYKFEPIGHRFNFAFFDKENPGGNVISRDFSTTSITLETKFSYRENFLRNRNERISLGAQKGPTIIVSYTHGFDMNKTSMGNFFSGEFDYDKLNISISQKLRMGRLGEGDYILTGGRAFNVLPYPLLDVQRGNQSFISNRTTYNLMNLFEFVCDQFVALNYEHHFGGAIFNRMPLVKKWKLRLFTTGKGVWGSISDGNLALLPKVDEDGRKVTQFYQLNREPYVEVGYGVENIFSFMRVDFIHRMTHLDIPGAPKFGVKISMQFSF